MYMYMHEWCCTAVARFAARGRAVHLDAVSLGVGVAKVHQSTGWWRVSLSGWGCWGCWGRRRASSTSGRAWSRTSAASGTSSSVRAERSRVPSGAALQRSAATDAYMTPSLAAAVPRRCRCSHYSLLTVFRGGCAGQAWTRLRVHAAPRGARTVPPRRSVTSDARWYSCAPQRCSVFTPLC